MTPFHGIPDAKAEQQSFSGNHEAFRKQDGPSVLNSIGDSKMIALKFIAVVLGAGTLLAMFSGDFDPELLLAIVSCLA